MAVEYVHQQLAKAFSAQQVQLEVRKCVRLAAGSYGSAVSHLCSLLCKACASSEQRFWGL